MTFFSPKRTFKVIQKEIYMELSELAAELRKIREQLDPAQEFLKGRNGARPDHLYKLRDQVGAANNIVHALLDSIEAEPTKKRELSFSERQMAKVRAPQVGGKRRRASEGSD